ncbi:MAG: 30S ribosomal protein THX [Cytophagales bacterium]|nr:30S ribosomal protein THX [Cytophagales bacterium]
MGKGDIKTRRGKITNKTFGARRKRKKNKNRKSEEQKPEA